MLGDDLPREAQPVLEPAADTLLATVRQMVPVVVDLLLVVARDHEGDGLAELEFGSAIQRDEALAVDLEIHGHDGPGLLPRGPFGGLRIRRRLEDSPVLK